MCSNAKLWSLVCTDVESRLISWNRGSKVITKALGGICDFTRLPSNCQPPTFWVSAYLTGRPECVHTYACTYSPFLSLSVCLCFIHCLSTHTHTLFLSPSLLTLPFIFFLPFSSTVFLFPETACFWCFRSCWKNLCPTLCRIYTQVYIMYITCILYLNCSIVNFAEYSWFDCISKSAFQW